MSFSRSQRSSAISPFRSRKSPAQPPPPAPKPTGRPLTPSSTTSSRPPSRLSSSAASSGPSPTPHDQPETSRSKENVTVTVRFRPLRYCNNTVYLTCSFLVLLTCSDWSVVYLIVTL
jgi:centromeric protein E